MKNYFLLTFDHIIHGLSQHKTVNINPQPERVTGKCNVLQSDIHCSYFIFYVVILHS